MKKPKAFGDGSRIEWNDRETLRYREGSRSLLVWVDYEIGFFRRGRVIHSASLLRWETSARGVEAENVEPSKAADILKKVQEYYADRRIPSRVIP